MTPTTRKRGRGRPPLAARARKRQKRLDAIVDKPPPAPPASSDDPDALLRRSSRVRRAPQVLDSSPVPSLRRRSQPKPRDAPTKRSNLSNSKPTTKPKKEEDEMASTPEKKTPADEGAALDRSSSLRSRAGKGRNSPLADKREIDTEDKEPMKPVTGEGEVRSNPYIVSYRRRRKRGSSDTILNYIGKNGNQDPNLPANDREDVSERALDEKIIVVSDSHTDGEPEKPPDATTEQSVDEEEVEIVHEDGQCEADHNAIAEELVVSPQKPDNVGADDGADSHLRDNPDGKASKNEDVVQEEAAQSEDVVKEEAVRPPDFNKDVDKPRVKEGRRCGLCGGGMDGRPPKKLMQESTDSDNEAYEGSSASEEPNYDPWDGFGDEPGWLGRLLGPMHDRFGIARVWVHIHCAVWSPEVYFAGLGCLKNVRAALCRGRALKCSRCGRPGATIGCRVDRCPKTYHLPCSRAEGCIFDHRKFLIACNDHRRLFEPQGNSYNEHIRKMKAKKLKSDIRKHSNDALRKDLEAEEKWLENCGEDEEFLKREGKRLQRDILRNAPVYIGGSCENDNSYQGWESVAGLQNVIQCMKEVVIIPLLYPEFFSNMGLTPPRGVLLHGYPGTGKTLVVRALIGACSRGDRRIAYFARKGADCLGKYVGDAERQLRLLFQVAERSQPSIIFFDEIDGLAPRRSRHQDQTHSSVVSTLLSLLDGLKSRGSVIVLGATNRPDAVDPALRRPGRFDREIYFPLPSVNDRSAILSLHTKGWPNPIRKPFLSWIANQTAGYAGADLQSLCAQAAMNALKRKCGLQELLSDAEKGSNCRKLPPLPSVVVEERDWLAALAFAPPPCSRRESGIAANEVVSSPLHAHLIPCLLGPLSFLLISIYIDERIQLPSSLLKASKSTRRVIFSSLEQKGIPVRLWRLHIHSLVQQSYVAKEIERNLSHYGLLIDQSIYYPSYVLGDDDDDEYSLDSCKAVQRFPLKLQRKLGFRALIAGTPRSGQQHLASSLLHGFLGHIEIQKVNLATISQEGRGDIIHGLTQILLKCLSVGQCIIYMPRVDLWAISNTLGEEAEELKSSPKRIKSSMRAGVHAAGKCASEAWISFVEQVDSACTSASIIILATSEVPNQDLPTDIRQFFTTNISNHTDSTSLEHSIPRFSLHLDGNFNHDLAIKAAAKKLSQDLVQHYVHLIHHRTHMIDSRDEKKVPCAPGVASGAQKEIMGNVHRLASLNTAVDSEQPASKASLGTSFDSEKLAPKASSLDITVDSEIAPDVEAACRDEQFQLVNYNGSESPLSVLKGGEEISVQISNLQDSFPKVLSSKFVKGSSTISTIGYQILQHPLFAELCWVTSKLKDGPCTDITGPWKGWPFNTCIMQTSSSPDKVVARVSSSNLKDKGSSVTVRGLVAVGLLAYRGAYTSVREVSFEIRKVLELLVGNIRAKILGGKDRYRYVRLLSQVAHLEDMVKSWAYTYQSWLIDNQVVASTAKLVDVRRPCTDNMTNDSNPLVNCSMLNDIAKCSNNGVKISCVGSPQKSATINHESVDFSKGLAYSFPNSDVTTTPEGNQQQDPFPQAPLFSSFHQSSSAAASALVSGDGSQITDGLTPSNILEPTGTNLCFDGNNMNISVSSNALPFSRVSNECSCLENSGKDGSISGDMNINSDIFIDKSSTSLLNGISCFYDCCSGCLHTVNELAQSILSDYWISSGFCPTIDDLHDVVTSCSLNVLAGVRKYYSSQSETSLEACKEQSDRFQFEHCCCQEIGAESVDRTKESLFQRKKTRRNKFLPSKCFFHMNKEDIATAKIGRNSRDQPALSFFFRDGSLMSSDPHEDAVLHCRFENLCLCTIVEIILMFKQPSV